MADGEGNTTTTSREGANGFAAGRLDWRDFLQLGILAAGGLTLTGTTRGASGARLLSLTETARDSMALPRPMDELIGGQTGLRSVSLPRRESLFWPSHRPAPDIEQTV